MMLDGKTETCRVLFQKISLSYCASGLFCYINILRCTVLQRPDLNSPLMGVQLFHSDGQTDRRNVRQTDMTRPIVVFRNFASILTFICLRQSYIPYDLGSRTVRS
jgi:hypothetical protein